MAVRSVLGKLGRSRFIHNNERLIMAGSSPTVCSSPHHPFDYYGVVHDQNKADKKRNPFLHGSLMKKNIQLQSVRVLSVVVSKDYESPRYISSYDLSLEADDAGVMRYFQVEVSVNSSNGMCLEECYLLVDNQKPIRLYHYLDNFFGAYAEARQQVLLEHQRKLRNETRG